jgi:hypothetical protein
VLAIGEAADGAEGVENVEHGAEGVEKADTAVALLPFHWLTAVEATGLAGLYSLFGNDCLGTDPAGERVAVATASGVDGHNDKVGGDSGGGGRRRGVGC